MKTTRQFRALHLFFIGIWYLAFGHSRSAAAAFLWVHGSEFQESPFVCLRANSWFPSAPLHVKFNLSHPNFRTQVPEKSALIGFVEIFLEFLEISSACSVRARSVFSV
jgi:hypothetical protein